MSNRDGSGHGARDQDPISIMLLIFMGFVALVWLSNGAFSPIPASLQGSDSCPTTQIICYGNISTDFGRVVTITTPLLIIAVPLSLAMFGYYLMRELGGRDPREYFETEILRTRAMVTEEDKIRLVDLNAAEVGARTRAEKNAVIAEYNAKVDEINARRARFRRMNEEDLVPTLPTDSTNPRDEDTAEYNKEVQEENQDEASPQRKKKPYPN